MNVLVCFLVIAKTNIQWSVDHYKNALNFYVYSGYVIHILHLFIFGALVVFVYCTATHHV